MKLSMIDQVAPPAYEPIIYYYPSNDNQTISETLGRLEKSLSETLVPYYPLAGRYIEEKTMIDCNDQGLEYCEAKVVNVKLDEFLQGEIEVEKLNCLVPHENEMAFSPIVAAIQISMFEFGGMAICVSISHKVADGFTVSAFINGWSTASRLGFKEVVQPSFNLASIFPPRENYRPNLPRLDNRVKLVTKMFVFNGTSISTLKERVRCQIPKPSRVEMVTALVWRALIRVSEVKNKRLRASLATHSLNLRGKTMVKTPDISCGNLYALFGARFSPKELGFVEVHDLVSLQRNAMREAIVDFGTAKSGDELCVKVLNSWRNVIEEEKGGEVDIHLFTSLCRFPLYEADFGWGKPIWVSSVHKAVEMVIFLDTKCGAGVEAWVTLNENDMNHLQQYLVRLTQ
ncbi:hypothetical protein FNV43_RR22147 [Rhamnella rubrinervis]|uniref:Uncharacterized protein n=1 Tax=Rhamnella rubrinervis TaxID=2594499 RepID=A0A8K0DWH8_9ROSA|nr:hypothetical protein FNV43_RR22147 [Rhamnella rubrinervis]